MTPRTATGSRLERLLPGLLFVSCFALYVAGGVRLAATPMFERDNVFFRSDTHRVFVDLTGGRSDDHRRTSTHPAFVLLHNPLGQGLAQLFAAAGTEPEAARRRASLLLTAAGGALTAALGFLLLRGCGVRAARAALFAAILGVSSSHWVFASIPETWIFSALGLTAAALAAVRPAAPEWRFQLAAVYSIAVVTTNLVPVAILALLRAAQRGGSSLASVLGRGARSTVLALAFTAALALVQHAVYPTTALFFLPGSVTKETKWVKWSHWLERPATTVKILVRHLAVDNLAAPEAANSPHDGLPMARIEEAGRGHYGSRLPVLAAWGAVLAVAAWGAMLAVAARGVRRELLRPPLLAALAILCFDFAFHSFFGNDRFLYSCGWTVFSVAAVAVAFDAGAPRGGRWGAAATGLLGLFLALQLASNWRFLGELAAAVGG
jgi:hypothetical protein